LIIFGATFVRLKIGQIFVANWSNVKNWLEPKNIPPNQVNLVRIFATQSRMKSNLNTNSEHKK